MCIRDRSHAEPGNQAEQHHGRGDGHDRPQRHRPATIPSPGKRRPHREGNERHRGSRRMRRRRTRHRQREHRHQHRRQAPKTENDATRRNRPGQSQRGDDMAYPDGQQRPGHQPTVSGALCRQRTDRRHRAVIAFRLPPSSQSPSADQHSRRRRRGQQSPPRRRQTHDHILPEPRPRTATERTSRPGWCSR